MGVFIISKPYFDTAKKMPKNPVKSGQHEGGGGSAMWKKFRTNPVKKIEGSPKVSDLSCANGSGSFIPKNNIDAYNENQKYLLYYCQLNS